MEDRWPSSRSIMKCNESVTLLSKPSNELQPGQVIEMWPCSQQDWYTQHCSAHGSQRERSWFMWQHGAPQRAMQYACYKYAKFGIILIFDDCCYSDACLGKEGLRVCALGGLWPRSVRIDPSLQGPFAPRMSDESCYFWQYIMRLRIVGCGWFPTHLGQNFWAWSILVTYPFQ